MARGARNQGQFSSSLAGCGRNAVGALWHLAWCAQSSGDLACFFFIHLNTFWHYILDKIVALVCSCLWLGAHLQASSHPAAHFLY